MAAVLALGAGPASAAVTPSGGSSTLTVSPALRSALTRAHAKLTAAAPARQSGRGYTLPLAGGSLDPVSGTGSESLAGRLVLAHGARHISVRSLLEQLGRSSYVTAVIGRGERLTLLTLGPAGGAGGAITPQGLRGKLANMQARLTAAAARALDAALHSTLFKSGTALGTFSSTARFSGLSLSGGSGALALDPAVLARLAGADVQLLSTPPAGLASGTLTLPLGSGALTLPGLGLPPSSTIPLEGGIAFAGGTLTVSFAGLQLSVTPTGATLSGIPPLRLPLATIAEEYLAGIQVSGGTVTFPPLPLTISPQLTAALAPLGIQIPAGTPLGTLTLSPQQG